MSERFSRCVKQCRIETLETRRLLSGDGLQAEYFNNLDFTAPVLQRVDPTINFNWGYNAPAPGVGADTFSVRWTGQIEAEKTETYTFYLDSDDGVRLWIDGQLLIDNWTVHAATTNTATIDLVAGQKYDIKLEYFDNYNEALARLSWSSPTTPKQVVPQSRLYSGATTPEEWPVISIVATTPNAYEEGEVPGVFTISRTGDTSKEYTIRVATYATADPQDYILDPLYPGYITIPAGQASTTVTLKPIDDSLVEGTEEYSITLLPFAWEKVTIDPENSSATVYIIDNDQLPVGDCVYLSDLNWVSASSPYSGVKKDAATLGGPLTINGQTFAKGLGVHSPSTLIYNLDGQYTTFTAMVGIDDAVGNGTVDGNVEFQVWVDGVLKASVFRTGADDAQAISVDVTGAQELKLITTTNGSDYKDHANWADAKLTCAPTVELPVVSLTPVVTEATEGESEALIFSFTRTGPTDECLTVHYVLSGTATNNADYIESPSTWTVPIYSLIIPAGETSASLNLSMFIDDTEYEGDETVIVTLVPGEAYTVDPDNNIASGVIHDNDPAPELATVTLSVTNDSIIEQYPDEGTTIRVTRAGGDLSQPLPIVLEASGTAEPYVDWLPYPRYDNLVIPAGESYVEFSLGAIRDMFVEGDETIIFTLKPAAGYVVGAQDQVTITLIDNDFFKYEDLYLSDRTPTSAVSPYFGLHTDRSVLGRPLTIGGQTFDKGLGVHSTSRVTYQFSTSDTWLTHFSAWVGIDDEVGDGSGDGSAVFEVWADGVLVASSGRLTGADGPQFIEVDLDGPGELVLVTTTGGDNDYKDHADWGDVIVTRRIFEGIF